MHQDIFFEINEIGRLILVYEAIAPPSSCKCCETEGTIVISELIVKEAEGSKQCL